jgi:hypothetical protein
MVESTKAPHDPQDKLYWIEKGEGEEIKFVDLCKNELGLEAEINPAKEKDRLAPDLIVEGKVADLKTQNTPFFKSGLLYGIPPEFAVTFNGNDLERYTADYPEIDIYFWVHWQQLERVISGTTYTVEPLCGVFKIPLVEITRMVKGGAPLHEYKNRKGDRVNAKDSYVLDLRGFEEIAKFES